jgi:hypothetical protein
MVPPPPTIPHALRSPKATVPLRLPDRHRQLTNPGWLVRALPAGWAVVESPAPTGSDGRATTTEARPICSSALALAWHPQPMSGPGGAAASHLPIAGVERTRGSLTCGLTWLSMRVRGTSIVRAVFRPVGRLIDFPPFPPSTGARFTILAEWQERKTHCKHKGFWHQLGMGELTMALLIIRSSSVRARPAPLRKPSGNQAVSALRMPA